MVMGMANLAMATGNIGREGVGVNPLRGQNNVQGSCDMGSFPHEFSGYRHVSDDGGARACSRRLWGVHARRRAGPAHPQHVRRRARRHASRACTSRARTSRSPTPTPSTSTAALRGDGMRRRPGPLPERDGEVRARLPAGLVVPREGRHVHQRRAPHLPRAQGDAAAWPATADWEITMRARRTRWAIRCTTTHPSRDHGRDRAPHADVRRRHATRSSTRSAAPVAVQRRGAGRHADHARRRVRARQGQVHRSPSTCRPTSAPTARFPLLLTTGPHPQSQYNVGAQTRRTANVVWHRRGRARDPSARRREPRHPRRRPGRRWPAAPARRRCAPQVTERMQPGVVYTTFHHPVTGANVVTTENSDWATNCPEYKVTAVQVRRTNQPLRLAGTPPARGA